MIPTSTFKEATKLGEAQALIERARELICDATGDNDADGYLKDAWGDTLPEAVDALRVTYTDRDEIEEHVEGVCKRHLSSRQSLSTPMAVE